MFWLIMGLMALGYIVLIMRWALRDNKPARECRHGKKD